MTQSTDQQNLPTIQLLHADLLETLTQHTLHDLESLALETLIVRLYDQGELSSEQGAKILGITRRVFLDLLGRYQVSIFDEEMDLQQEASHG